MPQLDHMVCRGSLVFCSGKRFVITRKQRSQVRPGKTYWDAVEITEGGDFIVGNMYFELDSEVDSFFPGAVYPLPDYIR